MVDWDVGRERKILVLIKDRRMTVFCLTDYDRLEILSVHRKIREKSRKHSLMGKASKWTSGDFGQALSSTTFLRMAEA